MLLAQWGDQMDIFWKFYSPADTLWSPQTIERVSGYATVQHHFHQSFLNCHHWNSLRYFPLHQLTHLAHAHSVSLFFLGFDMLLVHKLSFFASRDFWYFVACHWNQFIFIMGFSHMIFYCWSFFNIVLAFHLTFSLFLFQFTFH